MIRFTCNHCDKRLKVHDSQADTLGQCPFCRNMTRAPSLVWQAEEDSPSEDAHDDRMLDPRPAIRHGRVYTLGARLASLSLGSRPLGYWLKRLPWALVVSSTIAALMCLWCFERHPYSYYQWLRWVVCGAAAWGVITAWVHELTWAAWGYAVIVLIFNPLVPFHMKREVWLMFDLATAIWMLAIGLVISVMSVLSDTDHQVVGPGHGIIEDDDP